jgi:hypothetical protein
VATAEAQWQPYSEDSAAIKECAEVDYVPEIRVIEVSDPISPPLPAMCGHLKCRNHLASIRFSPTLSLSAA